MRRALLVAGDVKWRTHDRRHFNDLTRWGKELDRRGFECRACVGDGQVPLALREIRMYSGRRQAIFDQLWELATLDDGDQGVLVVANHGDTRGVSCFGTGPVTPDDVSHIFADCSASIVMVLGQCHAGAFSSVAHASKRVAVVAACSAAQKSWPTPDKIHNEFLHQLREAWFRGTSASSSLGDAFMAARDAVRTPCSLAPHDGCEHAELHDPQGVAATFVL